MNMNAANFLTKAVGVTGLGLIAYDSHNAGKIESSSYQKHVKANGLTNTYMDTLTLDSPSIVKSKIKNKYMHLRMDENISDFFTGIGGYVKGLSSMLVSNVVPLALSVGAVVKNKVVSKASAIGLLAYGGIYVGREVLGIGKPNQL